MSIYSLVGIYLERSSSVADPRLTGLRARRRRNMVLPAQRDFLGQSTKQNQRPRSEVSIPSVSGLLGCCWVCYGAESGWVSGAQGFPCRREGSYCTIMGQNPCSRTFLIMQSKLKQGGHPDDQKKWDTFWLARLTPLCRFWWWLHTNNDLVRSKANSCAVGGAWRPWQMVGYDLMESGNRGACLVLSAWGSQDRL